MLLLIIDLKVKDVKIFRSLDKGDQSDICPAYQDQPCHAGCQLAAGVWLGLVWFAFCTHGH